MLQRLRIRHTHLSIRVGGEEIQSLQVLDSHGQVLVHQSQDDSYETKPFLCWHLHVIVQYNVPNISVRLLQYAMMCDCYEDCIVPLPSCQSPDMLIYHLVSAEDSLDEDPRGKTLCKTRQRLLV